jgi:MAF protein
MLDALGVGFTVVPSGVDEVAVAGTAPPEVAVGAVALAKARAVRGRDAAMLALAADTVVIADGRALGKPVDADDARAMLRDLRARDHEVVTATCVVGPRGEAIDTVTTQVTMRDYGDAAIDEYVASGAPLDKAGAYGIQDEPFSPVASIRGCWCNVVGLPLWTTIRLLAGARRLVARRPDEVFARCAVCPLRDPGPVGAPSASRRGGRS